MGFLDKFVLNNTASMTSREMSELVEKRHDNVKRTIDTLVERGVIRSPQIEETVEINNLGHPRKIRNYVFSGDNGKRDSIVVVAQLSPEFTARLVDRWRYLEAASRFKIPETRAEALRLSADLADEVERLEGIVEKAQPKIEFHDAVKACPATMEIGRFAKIIGTGRNRLFQWLRDHKYLMAGNLPYQPYIDNGLFKVVERVITIKNEDVLKSTTLITGKGQTVIHRKFIETANDAPQQRIYMTAPHTSQGARL